MTILRTRTAIGQICLDCNDTVKFDATLTVVHSGGSSDYDVDTSFYYPHLVKRQPEFRFLDVVEYYKSHSEKSKPPSDKIRQDGVYINWDAARISTQLTEEKRQELSAQITKYSPRLYAFIPYQGSVWGEMNLLISGARNRNHLYPGLILAVNRQRLADKFEIEATRFETFSRNVFVIVHFDNAKPDQGRKTVQDDVKDLANAAADRAVQYLAEQRELLKPAGDAPTPDQRQVEKDHDDWLFNVRTHAKNSPLHLPPLSYVSTPLAEQDIVGLFHQLSALSVFPGIQIFATSQSHTYDCLINFDCASDANGLNYESLDKNPLGISPYIRGDNKRFTTRHLTVEFKNNLDGLIDELGSGSDKRYSQIDVCICWSVVGTKFKGYTLEEIGKANLDERAFPGITHVLRRDSDAHVIQVMLLQAVTNLIKAGKISIS